MREYAAPVQPVTAEAYEDGKMPRRLHREVIPSSYSTPQDSFAPYKGEQLCLSRSGRWRSKHEADEGSGRGGRVRCIFCDAPME